MRIIAASNRPLEKLVAQGLFREDLFYRVRVFPIRIPALRERPEDIDPLIDWYPRRTCRRSSARSRCGSAPRRASACAAYDWPGNVRELRNCLERAIILADDGRDRRDATCAWARSPSFLESARDETLEQARERAAPRPSASGSCAPSRRPAATAPRRPRRRD